MKPLVQDTMSMILHKMADQYGSRTALSYGNIKWTYKELDVITEEIAAGLNLQGIQKGDHVGILSENTPNAIFSFLAIEKMGAVACLFNTALNADELHRLFHLADLKYLMIGGAYKQNDFAFTVQKATKNYLLQKIFDISFEPREGYISFDDLRNMGAGREDSYQTGQLPVSCQDNGMILFSSGTTGQMPKAIVSSYFNLINGGIQKAAAQNITEQDVVCCALQMPHIFCIDVNIMAAFTSGAQLAMPVDLHTKSILETIEKEHCTVLSCIPCMFWAMMERNDFYTYNLSSLRTGIVGGAYCSTEQFINIEKNFGLTLLPGLGQTEATAGVAIADISDSLEVRSTTLGHFVSYSEGKIVDMKTGLEAEQGQVGEIYMKSPLLMTGYYKRPDLTREVIDEDGWLHTGDLAWQDEHGYLHYAGRVKELINRGGEKINPTEVENVINQLQEVISCKVIGVPDYVYGEAVCACIIWKKGHVMQQKEIYHYLEQKMAPFKIPKYFVYLQSFPTNANGKIKNSKLREMALKYIQDAG